MGKVRRGGYVFVTWVGDHPPPHVHMYRDGRLLVRWNLEAWRPFSGSASRRVRRLLRQLVEEGLL